MTLVECKHRQRANVTRLEDTRKRFKCADCGDVLFGPLPENCLHELSIAGHKHMVDGEYVDVFSCSQCPGLFRAVAVSFTPGELKAVD